MLDATRFLAMVQRLGGRGPVASLVKTLLAAYSEPYRAYHNAVHIADCLNQFDQTQVLAMRPGEVEAAIWFHDAVYDPKASDNEARSAAWAVEALNDLGVDPEVLRRIAALILATKHDREPIGADQALLVDVDLSILGRDPETFAAYDAAIRREYGWVPDDQYRAGRCTVLERFLKPPTIYRTEFFRKRYETTARRNLERAVAALAS